MSLPVYINRTDDSNGWYHGGSPFENGRACAPATLFPAHTSISSGWFMPNMHGNRHARQEWNFFAPMLVGDQVLATRTIAVDRYEKRGRLYIVCEQASYSHASSGQLLQGWLRASDSTKFLSLINLQRQLQHGVKAPLPNGPARSPP
jgi:hypothetical protein